MTPTTAAVMPVSGAVNLRLPCVDSINGPPSRMKKNDGRKVKKVTTVAAAAPDSEQRVGAEAAAWRPAADEADERDDHDQRPGRGLAERQAVDHLRRAQPVVVLDGALVDVGQHRVGAAEGEQRGLGEEPAPSASASRPSRTRASASPMRGRPEAEANARGRASSAASVKTRMRRRRRVVVDERRAGSWPALPWPPPVAKRSGAQRPPT